MFMEHKFLKMRDGAELAVKIKESGSPIWIIATHGIGEHMGRHQYIPDLFGHDFNIFQYDLRGHGRSMGRKAYISDFNLYMEDLQEIIRFLSGKYRMKKFILFGHSMGALITSAFMQNYVEEEFYPIRIVLNAPPCGLPGPLGHVLGVMPTELLNGAIKLPFSVAIGGLVDAGKLSHNPKIKDEYFADEFNATKLETKLLLELAKSALTTFARPLRSKADNFVSIGDADVVVNYKSALHYFNVIDKSFKLTVFEGAYHEIHNEIEKYRRPYFDYLKSVMNETIYSKED